MKLFSALAGVMARRLGRLGRIDRTGDQNVSNRFKKVWRSSLKSWIMLDQMTNSNQILQSDLLILQMEVNKPWKGQLWVKTRSLGRSRKMKDNITAMYWKLLFSIPFPPFKRQDCSWNFKAPWSYIVEDLQLSLLDARAENVRIRSSSNQYELINHFPSIWGAAISNWGWWLISLPTAEVFGAPIKSSAQVAATQGSSLEEELIMLRAEVWVGRMCGKSCFFRSYFLWYIFIHIVYILYIKCIYNIFWTM